MLDLGCSAQSAEGCYDNAKDAAQTPLHLRCVNRLRSVRPPLQLMKIYILVCAVLAIFCARLHAQTGIYVNPSNNVGIGTANPQVPLQIHVGTDQNFFFDSSLGESRISIVNDAFNANPNIRFQAAAYKFLGASGAGPYLTINSSGNVGIGVLTTRSWT